MTSGRFWKVQSIPANTDRKPASLSFTQVFKPDPDKPEAIRIEGTAAASSNDVRTLLEGTKYSSEYDLSSGEGNTWTLTMKPLVEKAFEEKTDQQDTRTEA